MKRFILISLLVMPFCKAADPYASWERAVKQYRPIEQKIRLSLNGKHITAIPSDLNLPVLRMLRLDKNQIATIPVGLILSELQLLNLSYNEITAIPAGLTLPELQLLDLSYNEITAIPGGLVLPKLQVLGLNNNQITQIPTGLTLYQLRALHLENNQISDIDSQAIKQFPYLSELHLNQNPITLEKVEQLRQAVSQTHPDLKIIANNVGPQHDKGPQYRFGARIRPAKKPATEEEK